MISEPTSRSQPPVAALGRAATGVASPDRLMVRRRILPYAAPPRDTSRAIRGNWLGTLGLASVLALMVLSAVAYAVAN